MPTATAKPRTPAQIAAVERMHAGKKAKLEAPATLPEPRKVAPEEMGAPTLHEKMLMEQDQKFRERVPVESLGDPRLGDFAKVAKDQGVRAASTEPPKYVVYDDWGIARRINRNTYQETMRGVTDTGHRLHESCPLCNKLHPESESNPNACPARKKITAYECPVCLKLCWPNMSDLGDSANAPQRSDDPYVKRLETDDKLIERMAMTNLYDHMGTYHPSEAKARNIALNPLAYGATMVGGK